MIYFDTETTGLIKNAALPLDKQPRIIEIGALREPIIKGRPNQFSIVLNPGVKLEPIITKITGLTDDDVAECQPFSEVLSELCDFFLGETTMIAHNMPFDGQMLVFELRRLTAQYKFPWPSIQIDTVQMARKHYGGKFKKLTDLHEELVGPYEQKHRALDDCKVLQRVYHQLLAMEP